MADYDLVIFGGALEGRIAAMAAASYGARVALLEPAGLFEERQQQQCFLEGLQQLGQTRKRRAVSKWFGDDSSEGKLDWSQIIAWSQVAAESQSVTYSVAAMTVRGVDVVTERPETLSRRMVVTTRSRRLRARGGLIACGLVPFASPLFESDAMPDCVDVVGDSASAVVWSESLAAVGVKVRLVTQRLLSSADGDVRRWVRSRLIATDIERVATGDRNRLTLKVDSGKSALSFPTFANPQPNRSCFLSVNRRLQTAHPRLFACGSVLGGSTNASLAEYEAHLAVRNALFLPTRKVNYEKVVSGCGRYARVGLTQAEATHRYGEAVRVQVASDANSLDLSRVDPMPEYCKLVFASDRLVGVHLLGEGAAGLASLLAKSIGQSLTSVARRQFSSQRLERLFVDCVGRSQQSQWQPGRWRRDWAENWFNWRRSR